MSAPAEPFCTSVKNRLSGEPDACRVPSQRISQRSSALVCCRVHHVCTSTQSPPCCFDSPRPRVQSSFRIRSPTLAASSRATLELVLLPVAPYTYVDVLSGDVGRSDRVSSWLSIDFLHACPRPERMRTACNCKLKASLLVHVRNSPCSRVCEWKRTQSHAVAARSDDGRREWPMQLLP